MYCLILPFDILNHFEIGFMIDAWGFMRRLVTPIGKRYYENPITLKFFDKE